MNRMTILPLLTAAVVQNWIPANWRASRICCRDEFLQPIAVDNYFDLAASFDMRHKSYIASNRQTKCESNAAA